MLEFDLPNLEQRRKEIRDEGWEAGQRGIPAFDAADDPYEQRICQEILALGEQAKSRLTHYLAHQATRAREILGASPREALNRELRDAEFGIQQISQTEGRGLRDARAQAEKRRQELLDFRRENHLQRAAVYPSAGKALFHWGIVVILFVFESFANANFLAKGNELGVLGAYTVSFGISLLNLWPAFLGFGPVSRGLWHVNPLRKALAGLCTAFYALFTLALNLAVAHYREVSGSLGDASIEVVRRVREEPFSFQDLESWILFCIGVLFSAIAFVDGWKRDDRYPGYGEVDREHRKAEEGYDYRRAEVTNLLEEVRRKALDTMKRIVFDARRQRMELSGHLEQRRSAERNYFDHLRQLNEIAGSLVAEYREANRKGRVDGQTPAAHRQPPPPCFPELLVGVPEPESAVPPEANGDTRDLEREHRAAIDQVHGVHGAVLADLFGEAPPVPPPAPVPPDIEIEADRRIEPPEELKKLPGA